ncbi:MAG: hypothetical protein ACPGUX_00815 [Halocynthiibacter sp.]
MTHPPSQAPEDRKRTDILIRAENGDVIRYDETGLVLRLSDRVLEDIAQRLQERGLLSDQPQVEGRSEDVTEEDEIELPDGVDAWSVRQDGDWIRFTANLAGKSGPRGFMCKGPGSAIVADTPTPLLGLFAIGGSRASLASDIVCDFPHHIVAPGDDIGAVGFDGEGDAKPVDTLHLLREMSHEAMVGQVLLNDALTRRDALPLYYTRAETDGSVNAQGLAKGPAFKNLSQAVRNMKAAAQDLGKRGEILGVFLDFALEDVMSNGIEYRDGMIALMENITRDFSKDAIPAPRFFAFFECGSRDVSDDSTLEGQWELSWNNAGHDLVLVAPGYMLTLDQDARLTDTSRATRAAMSAEAVAHTRRGERWYCPTLHLAERDDKLIRVTAQCHGKLVLDENDPFGSGKHYGFSLEGVAKDVSITSVQIDPKDPKSLLITCSKTVTGPAPVLRYASGQKTGQGEGYPVNCGALRDEFTPALHHDAEITELALLRRWALPARLKIN